jgi:hypothetical protein
VFGRFFDGSRFGFLGAVAAGDDEADGASAFEIESVGARPDGEDAGKVVWIVYTGVAEAAGKVVGVGEREAFPPEDTVWIGGIVGCP